MKEGGIVRRLFDVSVSILMAAVLLMSQSWAVTADMLIIQLTDLLTQLT